MKKAGRPAKNGTVGKYGNYKSKLQIKSGLVHVLFGIMNSELLSNVYLVNGFLSVNQISSLE